MTEPLDRLLRIMERLRDPLTGCEWDRVQTFSSIAPYTIEEAYEVADAIAREDLASLKDELGDLLLQVVFHARMAEERGSFTFSDVAETICSKLEARHPHIFSDAEPEPAGQSIQWERIKADERQAKGATSAIDGVAKALPALMRADKLQKRAAHQGFDWPDRDGPCAKLTEELAELQAASTADEQLEEAGDLLFSAVNVVRAFGVAPEDALRQANAKFERRFRAMEIIAQQAGLAFATLDIIEQEKLWQTVKAGERL